MKFRRAKVESAISSDALASFGRFEVLGATVSGVDNSDAFSLVEPLLRPIFADPAGGQSLVAEELRRHASVGDWEAIGAWKVVREFLEDSSEYSDLIDMGLLTIAKMQMTNLAIHLAPIDRPRYEELTGGPPENDGFWGPPVFASDYGPSHQYYLDNAVNSASARVVNRLPNKPGVDSPEVDDAAKCLWDFAQLILRGPLVVNPDIRFEPAVVRPAVQVATDTDHKQFIHRIADYLNSDEGKLLHPWAYMGASRFLEEYLDPILTDSVIHAQLVDAGLHGLLEIQALDVTVPVQVLTPFERDRLRRICESAR